MSNIKIYNYNNYANRIVKRSETLSGYGIPVHTENNVNFIPGDEVYTVMIAGTTNYNGSGNYVIECDANNNILTRWFIVDNVRTRNGQYELTLKRDVLADNYNDVLRAVTYIEKATITDPSDPLLFNKETLNVNQIKQKEIPLKDETECGWVVGYVAHNYAGGPVESNVVVNSSPDITVNNLQSWAYWNSVQSNNSYTYKSSALGDNILDVKIKWGYTYVYGGTDPDEEYMLSTISLNPTSYLGTNVVNSSYTQPTWWNDHGIYAGWFHTNYSDLPVDKCEAFASTLKGDTLRSYINDTIGNNITLVSEHDINQLKMLDGRSILDSSTNILYKIELVELSNAKPVDVTRSTTEGSTLLDYIDSNLSSEFSGTCTNLDVSVRVSSPAYALKLTQQVIKTKVNIKTEANRYHLEDSPYDMFCIPYSDDISIFDGNDTFKCSKSVALSMGVAIAETQSSTAIYDLQILPYCPARDVVATSNNPKVLLDVSKGNYDLIKNGDTKLSAVIWCRQSTFKVDINQRLELPEHLYCNSEEIDLLPDEYIDLRTPLSLNSFDITDSHWTVGQEYGITAIEHGIYTDSLKVTHIKYLEGNEIEIVDEYMACRFIFKYMGGDGTNNTVTIKDANGNIIETYNNNSYANLDEYIVIQIVNKDGSAGASGLGYGYPLERIFAYSYFYKSGPSALDLKINNECNMYRLCSPNYASAFEFSVAKSRGVEGFIAECTYKPFNPYIHVTPKLKGLYGENYVNIDDARGLICAGDFSLPALSNAWANYELQNKNYEAMFNRQIENLDVNNSIARTQALWSIGAGTLQGGISGATAGGMAGGAWGAVAGAAVGTVGSLAGGIADYSLLKKQQEENRDFTIDMHEYSLQNIKAIPSTITKTSALTYNTRLWPFVEVYTCTDKELSAFIDILKYKGMSVLRVGNIEEFKVQGEYTFVKGQIIRSNIVDGHVSQEVYNEINKGVFI